MVFSSWATRTTGMVAQLCDGVREAVARVQGTVLHSTYR